MQVMNGHNLLSTVRYHAIVEILNEDKERVFYKEVTLKNGKKVKMTLNIPARGIYDDHFSQGVSLARVVSIGKDVSPVKPGDMVIVDYSVDTDTAKIIEINDQGKYVRVVAANKFYDHDKMAYANKYERFDAYEYRNGDLEFAAAIFGIIKGDEIQPVPPYVFMQYVDLEGKFIKTGSGLMVPSKEGEFVIRQVLFAGEDSHFKAGDKVLVDFASLYERQVNDGLISICMEQDIIGTFP